MATDVICPDCGGIVGATEADAQGRGPCTCFKMESSGDTVSMPSSQESSTATAAVAQPKLCIVCGKDVSGHRRIKDSRGYTCYDCAKTQIAQEKEGTVRCAECGKRLKPEGLVEYEGIKICKKCFEDHKEIQKKAVKKVAVAQYNQVEKKKVIILAVVFGVLGLIVLWRMLFA